MGVLLRAAIMLVLSRAARWHSMQEGFPPTASDNDIDGVF
jgi:hypothetical protein